MKRTFSLEAPSATIGGAISQKNISIGDGGDIITFLFNTGAANPPGIRYTQQGWQYSIDGTTWLPFDNYISEAIPFTILDLDDNGILHIQHNFNNKYVLGLHSTVQPRQITYTDNELLLDYSDQNVLFDGGVVWFVGSKLSMLVSQSNTPVYGQYGVFLTYGV